MTWGPSIALGLIGALLLSGSYFGGEDAPGWILIAGVGLVLVGCGLAVRNLLPWSRP